MELSGLSSASRLYKKDVAPVLRKGKKSFKKRVHLPHRKPSRAARPSARMRVGEPIGSGNSKRHVASITGSTLLQSRTQYVSELTGIPEQVSSFDIDSRSRSLAVVKGFSIRMAVKNILDKPLYVNYAIVAPKESNGGVTTVDFFRGSGSERGEDFDNARTSLQFHSNAINTDLYEVLTHKRFRLGSATTTGVSDGVLNINDYVKLNRQVRYEGGVTTSGKVQIVFWCDGSQRASTATPENSMYTETIFRTFFDDPIHQC